jgi:calcium-dependent protein kinase
VGSPYCVAPEILDQNYTLKCDIWSLGVLCYALLTGKYPFSGASHEEIFEKIKLG